MSEPKVTTEEMLQTLKRRWPCPCKEYPESECSAETENICVAVFEAIRRLIEQRPKVTKKKVEDFALILLAAEWPEQINMVQKWIENIGVEVNDE
jgi:hypothetical protein